MRRVTPLSLALGLLCGCLEPLPEEMGGGGGGGGGALALLGGGGVDDAGPAVGTLSDQRVILSSGGRVLALGIHGGRVSALRAGAEAAILERWELPLGAAFGASLPLPGAEGSPERRRYATARDGAWESQWGVESPFRLFHLRPEQPPSGGVLTVPGAGCDDGDPTCDAEVRAVWPRAEGAILLGSYGVHQDRADIAGFVQEVDDYGLLVQHRMVSEITDVGHPYELVAERAFAWPGGGVGVLGSFGGDDHQRLGTWITSSFDGVARDLRFTNSAWADGPPAVVDDGAGGVWLLSPSDTEGRGLSVLRLDGDGREIERRNVALPPSDRKPRRWGLGRIGEELMIVVVRVGPSGGTQEIVQLALSVTTESPPRQKLTEEPIGVLVDELFVRSDGLVLIATHGGPDDAPAEVALRVLTPP